MAAGDLHCPSCGAAVSDGHTQCQYCGALLKTIACAKCFGLMFLGSQFCPHCGASALDPVIGQAVAHQCPLCNQPLHSVTIGAATLEECIPCAGIWVRQTDFNAICASSESQAAAMTLPVRLMPTGDVKFHYLKCPTCSNLMNRTNYAHTSGVVINVCKDHGIWFDHDGLRRVIEFIRGGGLERQRARETEELKRAQSAQVIDRQQPVLDHMISSYGTHYSGNLFLSAMTSIISSVIR
jgi:Zn-finger nucleic acid-binding protein